MGLNWKLVAGKALGTMAEREDEYRKFATDYYIKKYETRAEERRAWNETTREQKREIKKKIDALRAEGLNDTQIANGLNTYGENFFAVVADDLSNYKKSDNYKFLMRQDPTGAKFRDFYNDRFNNLIQTESQQGLQLDPVIQGLMDKFPEMTETPEIAQSIFGFDYTKGVRDDIKGLSKDTNVPDYDAPAGLVGVSGILGGTIRDVSGSATYGTAPRLNKEIVNRLKKFSTFGDLRTTVDGEKFETAGEKDTKKIALANRAATAQNAILQDFERRRASTAPASMEGGKTDQEILDEIMGEKNWSSANATGDQGDQGDQGNVGGTAINNFMKDNPESKITKAFEEGNAANVSQAAMLSSIQRVVDGEDINDVIGELNLTQSQANRVKQYIASALVNNPEQVGNLLADVISSTSDGEQGGQQQVKIQEDIVARPDTSELRGRERSLGEDRQKAWDDTYGLYLNPDGSLKEGVPQDKLDSALPLVKRQYEEKLKAIASLNPFD
jgi:hypothetical protein